MSEHSPIPKASLTKRATTGAAWLVIARLSTKAIDFVNLLILARLLSPSEFGITAVAVSVVQIIEAVFELPTGQVLIRQKEVPKDYVDTAFTLSVLRGLCLTTILLALTVPLSRFYHDDRLLFILLFIGLAPIARGLVSPRMVLYSRVLDFRRDFATDVFGKLMALGAATLAALAWHDYRALIVATVASPISSAMLSYALAPYVPRLSLRSWPAFAHFVGWSTASQFISAMNWQFDRLILGRLVPSGPLGDYSLANDLSFLPEQALIKPIVQPLMAAFAAIRDDDVRLQQAYTKSAIAVLAVGTPVLVGLSMLADPAVRLVLGGKWLSAIPILGWLPLTLVPLLYVSPVAPLAMAKGRPDIVWQYSALEALYRLPAIALGAFLAGIKGVIIARMVASCLATLVSFYYVRKLIRIPFYRQAMASWRVLAAAVSLAIFLSVVGNWLNGEQGIMLAALLFLAGALGLIEYCTALLLLWLLSGRPEGVESLVIEKVSAWVGSRSPRATA